MENGTLILEFLRSNPVFTLFVVLGCGYLVGRLRIGPVALGPVAGALLVSLFLGQYGFKINPGAQSVGFALFIFAVVLWLLSGTLVRWMHGAEGVKHA